MGEREGGAVESGDTRAPARGGKTGQQTCYDVAGAEIYCAGTGQDGDLQPGVAWPNPRFVDNADKTRTYHVWPVRGGRPGGGPQRW